VSPPTPWQRRDRFVTVVLALIGIATVGLCWSRASHEEAFRDQVRWTVGALAGCGVFALAGGCWILVGFRRTRHCMAQLRADSSVVFDLSELMRATDTASPASIGTEDRDAMVTADGMRLTHRRDCLLARGKVVRPVPPTEQADQPTCLMCH
jgi:hypothetical protein